MDNNNPTSDIPASRTLRIPLQELEKTNLDKLSRFIKPAAVKYEEILDKTNKYLYGIPYR